MRTAVPLIIFIALVAVAAFVGARFTPGAWYQSLERPPLVPPNWIFGPRVRTTAGALFVPDALWVSVATYLNAGFWSLNR